MLCSVAEPLFFDLQTLLVVACLMQVVCTLTALTDLSLKSNELTALTPLVGNLVELRTLDVRLLLLFSLNVS
jgi:hypothetical protein